MTIVKHARRTVCLADLMSENFVRNLIKKHFASYDTRQPVISLYRQRCMNYMKMRFPATISFMVIKSENVWLAMKLMMKIFHCESLY